MTDRLPGAGRPRVLKADAVRSGTRLRDEAALQAVAARRAAEAERAAALRSAYDDGRAAGLAEATTAGLEATQRAAVALETLATQSLRLHREAVDETNRAVLAAALDIAEWVLGHEVAADSRSLIHRLGQSAAMLLPSPTTRVAVSPHDLPVVKEWAATKRGYEVVADATLAPGDARLDTDGGSADASVAAALRVAAEMLGVDPSSIPS